MRAVLVALAVVPALAGVPTHVHAEPPGLVIPVPVDGTPFVAIDTQDAPAGAPIGFVMLPEAPVPSAPTSYRWQIVAADVAAVGSLVMALENGSKDWASFGLATYGLGAPMIHAANHHGGRALASLTVRIGLPLIGGMLGARQGCGAPAPGDGACGDSGFPDDGYVKGIAIGAVAAMAIDAWLIARPEHKPSRGWSPTASAMHGGVSVGASGAF